MKGPNDLDELSDDEERHVRELEKEITEHFQGSSAPYEFDPHSTGAGVYSDREKKEVIRRAKKADWIVTELDQVGGFTVRRP